MAYTTSDWQALYSLAKSMQGAFDTAGKVRRDVRFVLKRFPDLPESVYLALQRYETLLSDFVSAGDNLESGLLEAMRKHDEGKNTE